MKIYVKNVLTLQITHNKIFKSKERAELFGGGTERLVPSRSVRLINGAENVVGLFV
jgi:hypothetical protein